MKLLVPKVRHDLSWLAELRPEGALCANTGQFSLFLLSIVQRYEFQKGIKPFNKPFHGMMESFNYSVVFYQ